MSMQAGERLPEGQVLRMGENGPEAVATGPLFAGRRVVLFGLPGAYTGTCSTAHVPSFVRTKADLDAKGIDAVYCLAGNDPFVLKAWGQETGATDVGIEMLGDTSGDWIAALGTEMNVPHLGFVRRSRRFSALVEDGVVTTWNEEPGPGEFGATGGEAMLASL